MSGSKPTQRRARPLRLQRAVLPVVLAFSACTVGPDYHTPEVKAPATWRQTLPPASSQITSATTNATRRTIFHDPPITQLAANDASEKPE